MINLKKWILDNLFDSRNILISNKLSFKYYIKNNLVSLYDEILNLTSFLDDSVYFSERVYCILHDINSRKRCENNKCNNYISSFRFKTGYRNYCSRLCANSSKKQINKIQKTFQQKYGVNSYSQTKEAKNKQIIINRNKYGVDHYFQSSEFKQKSVNTNIKKYGYKSFNSSPVVKNNKKKTWLDKYGVDNPFKSELVRSKAKKTLLKKYGVEHFSQSQEFKNNTKFNNQYLPYIDKDIIEKANDLNWLVDQHYNKKKTITQIGKELQFSASGLLKKLRKSSINIIKFPSSSFEKEINDFIDVDNVKMNGRKIIPPYEIDIYLPEYKLAVEFNGLYWHSSYDLKSDNKLKKYHLMKTEMCEEQNIQLLHIFENEWLDPIKKEIWKSIINSKIGKNDKIHAGECEVKEIIDTRLIRNFLNENYLQGFVSSKIKLGLFHERELVSLMTFGKTRHSDYYQYKMIGFCNKKYLNVVDGASKLFKYFVRNYQPKNIISHANRRYSNNRLYDKLGFKHSHNSNPDYFYFKNKMTLHPRIMFQKHKLKKQLKSFDPKLTEIENMFNNGYRRIWDCGNTVYIYN